MPTPVPVPPEIGAMSFETAMSELEKLVAAMENGGMPLNDLVTIMLQDLGIIDLITGTLGCGAVQKMLSQQQILNAVIPQDHSQLLIGFREILHLHTCVDL